jgi:hypothetical protein
LLGKNANCWFFGRELLRPEVVAESELDVAALLKFTS